MNNLKNLSLTVEGLEAGLLECSQKALSSILLVLLQKLEMLCNDYVSVPRLPDIQRVTTSPRPSVSCIYTLHSINQRLTLHAVRG